MIRATITFVNEAVKSLLFDSWDHLTSWVERHHDKVIEIEAKQV